MPVTTVAHSLEWESAKTLSCAFTQVISTGPFSAGIRASTDTVCEDPPKLLQASKNCRLLPMGYRHGRDAKPSHGDSAASQGPLTPVAFTTTTTPGQRKGWHQGELWHLSKWLTPFRYLDITGEASEVITPEQYPLREQPRPREHLKHERKKERARR